MLQVKSRGFVSNIYVYTSIVVSASMALFASSFLFFFSFDMLLSTLVFLFVFLFMFFGQAMWAPFSCKRFCVSAEGIKCGKLLIKYSDVEKISIAPGHIKERFGFRFVENMFGINQHSPVYVEDIICINCDFVDFKKPMKECIYIPKNALTHRLLMRYCEKYASLNVDEQSYDLNYKDMEDYFTRGKIIRKFVRVFVCLLILTIPLFYIINESEGVYKVLAPLCVLLSGLFWLLLGAFKGYVTMYFRRRNIFKIKQIQRNYIDN